MRGSMFLDGPKHELRQFFEGRDALNDAKNYAQAVRRDYADVVIERLEDGSVWDRYAVICKWRPAP